MYRLLLLTIVVASLFLSSTGYGDVIVPSAPIAGQTQLEHAHQWWQTMLNLPLSINPITDLTGAQAFRGQNGSVLYLAGSFGGVTSRTVTVAPGTTLFLPLLNSYNDNANLIGQPPNMLTAQQLLDAVDTPPSVVQNLFLEIDGQSVGTTADLLNHRQVTDPNSPHTTVIQSPQNFYVDVGFDPTLIGDPLAPLDPANYPTNIFPAVVDGYWIGLTPFAPGTTHTIRFGGTIDQGGGNLFSQDNAFTIIVQQVEPVPEPASLLVWGALVPCVGAAFVYRRSRRRKAR